MFLFVSLNFVLSPASHVNRYFQFSYLYHCHCHCLRCQYRLYRRVVEHLRGRPVTIRTLDIGGDKQLDYFRMPPERNPALGWRGLRVLLSATSIADPLRLNGSMALPWTSAGADLSSARP